MTQVLKMADLHLFWVRSSISVGGYIWIEIELILWSVIAIVIQLYWLPKPIDKTDPDHYLRMMKHSVICTFKRTNKRKLGVFSLQQNTLRDFEAQVRPIQTCVVTLYEGSIIFHFSCLGFSSSHGTHPSYLHSFTSPIVIFFSIKLEQIGVWKIPKNLQLTIEHMNADVI